MLGFGCNLLHGGSMLSRFQDRHQASRVLARHLEAYARRSGVLVLALPRGGVPAGFEVRRALQATSSRSHHTAAWRAMHTLPNTVRSH